MAEVTPTFKGFMFGLLFALSLVASLLGSGYPYLQALTIILGGLLAGSYGYTLSRSNTLYQIRVGRAFSNERCIEGSEVEVFVFVENPTEEPIYRLEVEDFPPWRSRPKSSPLFIFSIGPKERKVFSYLIKPSFGRHRWNKLRLAIGDPFGLFRAERTLYIRSGISVLPSWSDVEGWIRKEELSGTTGELSRRRRGFSLEFYEIRDYQPGDDVRRIVWTATARTGKLMVREDLDEVRASVYLFLDISSSSWIGPPGRTPADLIAKVSAAILSLSARSGGIAGFTVFYGDSWRSFGPTRTGEALENLLVSLAIASPEDSKERILFGRALDDAIRRAENLSFIALLAPGALSGPSWSELERRLKDLRSGVLTIALPWGNDEVSEAIDLLERRMYSIRAKELRTKGIRIALLKSPFDAWEAIRVALGYKI
jgi:uncharacterized protein (DUF58 family)